MEETEFAALGPADFLRVGESERSRRIACLRRPATGAGVGRAGVVWLGGFRSNMRGVKASALDAFAAKEGRACLRFDYSGHGESDGAFAASTVGLWLEDSLAVLRALTDGPQIIVGSSMGGWIALLAARALQAEGEGGRLMGLVLIAPAVDFTERLIFDGMSAKERAELDRVGVVLRPSPYSADPCPIGRALIEEGRDHLLLGGLVRAFCPVHILQGMADAEVPWRHALKLVEHLVGDQVSLTLVKDGEHRLSREEDLALIRAAVRAMW